MSKAEVEEIKRKCIRDVVWLNMSPIDKLAYTLNPRNVVEVIETPGGERYYTFSSKEKDGSETGS